MHIVNPEQLLRKIKQRSMVNKSRAGIKQNERLSINPKEGRKRGKGEQRTDGTSGRQISGWQI